MGENQEMKMTAEDIQKQRNEWRKKGWSIPDLRGGKQIWYELVKNLLKQLESDEACDLNAVADLGGVGDAQTWRVYAPFLKGSGLFPIIPAG